MNDEQEVVKEVERFWGNLICRNGKVTLGQKKEMIGKGMASKGQIFRQQEMSVEIKKMKENKAADESGVIAEYLKALVVAEVEGEIQCGFRRWRHTEDNLFMLERLIEMVKGRKEEIFVAFLDIEKAYD